MSALIRRIYETALFKFALLTTLCIAWGLLTRTSISVLITTAAYSLTLFAAALAGRGYRHERAERMTDAISCYQSATADQVSATCMLIVSKLIA
jgi:hypothetical protein